VSVLLDIQAVQSPAHGERGIARYVLNLAAALELRHAGLVSGYLLNPGFSVPGVVEPLLGRGRVFYSDRIDPAGVRIYHVGSPIESVPLERLLPAYTRDKRVVVTLYDLIPKLFPETYLADPATLAWYGMRLELVRSADRILAISAATARDAVEELGVPAERVATVGAGVSEQFRRPESRQGALDELRRTYPWLQPGFVLYTGGIEPRKNIDRLLVAYAGLSRALLDEHQLVVVCRVEPGERSKLEKRLRRLGIADRVEFPGFVSDEDLVRLYQACALFVFPSLYEGFGLPVSEAIACGAPVIGSNTSSLPELVRDPDAQFDPRDPAAIRAAIEGALTNEDLRRRLEAIELDERHTWSGVADRTAAVYRELLCDPPPRRRRKRIAFVSPLPPARSGIADVSVHLVGELTAYCDVDTFADQPEAQAPAGVDFAPIQRFESAWRARGGYDRILVCLGNSEHHAEALALMRRHPAIVLAHDVRLTGLYGWMAQHRPDLEPRGFQGALHAMYNGRLPPSLGERGWLGVEEYDRYGVLMAREALSLSERYLVHSQYAADLARLDADERDEAKVGVLPFGMTAPEEFDCYARAEDGVTVATFGIVGPAKQPEKVLAAFAELLGLEPEAQLVFAGPVEPQEEARLSRVADAIGVADRVCFTGELTEDDFYRWITRASVALQLRSASNGETSATISQCLAAGVPTVVTAIGSAKELPDNAAVKVDRDVSASELAAEIHSLLTDLARQDALREAGLQHVRENSFARAAATLWQTIEA